MTSRGGPILSDWVLIIGMVIVLLLCCGGVLTACA